MRQLKTPQQILDEEIALRKYEAELDEKCRGMPDDDSMYVIKEILAPKHFF